MKKLHRPSLLGTLAFYGRHVWKYKIRAAFIALFIVIAVGSESVVPWYLKKFVDGLSNQTPGPAGFEYLLGIIIIIFAIRLVALIAWRVQGFITTDFQPRVMADLQTSSFSYVIDHSYKFYANNFAGSLVKKINRVSRGFERLADDFEYRFLPIAITIVGSTIGLALRFPWLGIGFLAWSLIFIIANYLAAVWKLKTDIKRSELDSEATGVLADAISNNVNIKLFSGGDDERSRYQEVMSRWRVWQTRGWNRGEWIFGVQSLLIFAIEVIMFYLGAKFWAQGLLTVGDFILIQTYLLATSAKLWDIGRSMRGVFEAVADADEMIQVLNSPHDILDLPQAPTLQVTNSQIEFKKVLFHYVTSRKVLKDFSLIINPGQKIAFVGPSGGGKSTITKLLFRFFDVESGQILIDDQDIAGVSQDSLRNQISLVPQEPILFHRSLMDNIRYGRRGATDKEVVAAAKRAHCHEFITTLPEKYKTFVGERGIKLSGGERQRVAIARAILKDAPILVLDEATSSLDSESERLIHDSLSELMQNKTVIVIAHRLSTIMAMDRIVVLENGRITADGEHGQLLKTSPTYSKLWSIQAGGFLP